MSSNFHKIVVFVPASHAEKTRQVLGEFGAGKIGNYDFCSFSVCGIGRFRGNEKSNPTVGKKNQLTEVEEERIETIIPEHLLDKAITKIKSVHPYEEPAIESWQIKIH